jgi:hypothetical protein
VALRALKVLGLDVLGMEKPCEVVHIQSLNQETIKKGASDSMALHAALELKDSARW